METRERTVVINDKEEHKFLNHFKCYDIGDNSSFYMGNDGGVGGNPIILKSHENEIIINKPHIGINCEKWFEAVVKDDFHGLTIKDFLRLRFENEMVVFDDKKGTTVKSLSNKLDLVGGSAVTINGKFVKVN